MPVEPSSKYRGKQPTQGSHPVGHSSRNTVCPTYGDYVWHDKLFPACFKHPSQWNTIVTRNQRRVCRREVGWMWDGFEVIRLHTYRLPFYLLKTRTVIQNHHSRSTLTLLSCFIGPTKTSGLKESRPFSRKPVRICTLNFIGIVIVSRFMYDNNLHTYSRLINYVWENLESVTSNVQ